VGRAQGRDGGEGAQANPCCQQPITLALCLELPDPPNRPAHHTLQEKKPGPEWDVRIDTSKPNRLRRETAFLCNIRFKNDLPEVPAVWAWGCAAPDHD